MTPLTEIVRHVDYIASRIGVDHVAFGSDFDGADDAGRARRVAGLPRLVEALRAAGYDDEALAKITHGNWLRVLDETWQPWARYFRPAGFDAAADAARRGRPRSRRPASRSTSAPGPAATRSSCSAAAGG